MQQPLPHCSGFVDTQTRDAHFVKHSKALPNPIQYERLGIDFMNRAVDEYNNQRFVEGVYSSVRSNGDFIVTFWDEDDNLGLFGSMDRNGRLRTFFGITSKNDVTQVFLSKMH